MKPAIVVVGSINMDLVVKVRRQPTPGETILGGDGTYYPGGKGANQAVAAARAGGRVAMVGLVGNDAFGPQLRENLLRSGVNVSRVGRVRGSSGLALITVDARGQNMIVVSPGANGRLTPDRLPARFLDGAAVALLQLEIPLATVRHVVREAAAQRVKVILNPAPAQPLPAALLRRVDYLIANETEAALLAGERSNVRTLERSNDAGKGGRMTREKAWAMACRLRKRGVSTAIVTLGSDGVVWSGPEGEGRLPAHRVQAADTTAAGDAFCGAFATRLAEGVGIEDALGFANAAGAVAVTRAGAQPSLPTRPEIEARLERPRP